MIRPTVGRVVHFFPQGHDHLRKHQLGGDPLVALIAGVHTDHRVNLAVFGADGSGPYARASVDLVQPDWPAPHQEQSYAAWMPYQVGQAAKTEALDEKLREAMKQQPERLQVIPRPELAPERQPKEPEEPAKNEAAAPTEPLPQSEPAQQAPEAEGEKQTG